ncbi:hypothetical protein [Nocardia sp. 348MFTsu5.1]|jgi:hypothetical protein|uniref:hypothetical protein n=1 Tax=Nocardia sp. 348MFTsu5.1 TaxID=1172185 RepID=UPI00037A55ED|nr:hypothetical protein [Nocardia sp. 348MFTsu5.1]
MHEPELFSHRETIRSEPAAQSPKDAPRIPQPIFSDQVIDPAVQRAQERTPR